MHDGTLKRSRSAARGMPSDPHAGHQHFTCSCGKVFHERQEMVDHARRLGHKAG